MLAGLFAFVPGFVVTDPARTDSTITPIPGLSSTTDYQVVEGEVEPMAENEGQLEDHSGDVQPPAYAAPVDASK